MWAHLELGDPCLQRESFVIGGGETKAEAIAQAKGTLRSAIGELDQIAEADRPCPPDETP